VSALAATPEGLTLDPRAVNWEGRDRRGKVRDFKAVLRKNRWWRTESGGYDVIGREADGVLVLKPVNRSLRDIIVWASGKSNYLISKVLNWFWNATAFTPPSALFFALWTASLTAASTGSTAGETAYTGYSRVSVTANTTNFPTSSGGAAIQNATAITWGANSGTASTITFVMIADASSAGNALYWGSITSTTVNAGDTPQINTNALTASEA
jgi:hypothetical protein